MNALKKLVYRHTPKFIRRVRFSRFRRAWVASKVVVDECYVMHEMSEEESWAEYFEFNRLDHMHYEDLLAAVLARERIKESIHQHGRSPELCTGV